ncbi:DUF6894 family protein [Belnapia moabensis]|uniref:DUF6894 family protein n=1 Tax=Belnapia moabensis TaxID=365533 RepID=UPI0005BC8F0E|nr:hypothetical protein [Belnapia moabensis]
MARAGLRLLSRGSKHGQDLRRLSLVPAPVGETYYFDIFGCGLSSRDDQGELLANLQAARLQAILTATQLLRATLDCKGTGQTVTVVVRDESGERYRVAIYAG